MTAHEAYKRKCKNPSECLNIVDVSMDTRVTAVFINGEEINLKQCVRCVIDIVAGKPVEIGLAYGEEDTLVRFDMGKEG